MREFRVRRFAKSKRAKQALSVHEFNTSAGAGECARMIERLGERAEVTWLAGFLPWVSFLPDGSTIVIESEASRAL